VRRIVAGALSIAIQTAALTAPFAHAHRNTPSADHDRGTTVHSHWTLHDHSHDASGPTTIEALHQDGDAVYLNAFAAVAVSSFSPPASTSDAFELPAPDELAAHRVVETVRSHDPPALPPPAARAPPAFLS
jgi:hypothetical protein